MTGTSPFTYQTPNFSSSYYPKMEADFMRDFYCCNITHPSMHDLLHHYEVCHAEQPMSSLNGQLQQHAPLPDSRAAVAAGAAQQHAQMTHHQTSHPHQPVQPTQYGAPTYMNSMPMMNHRTHTGNPVRTPLRPVQDIDVVEDMEMDDDLLSRNDAPPVRPMQHNQYTPPLPRDPRLASRSSPNWPHPARNSSYCCWSATVPFGLKSRRAGLSMHFSAMLPTS